MKFWKEFKAFISKGNVVDLAVAVIIGAAFGKIITSLVNDVVMPLISLAVGGASVADWKWIIKPAVYDANGVLLTAETALKYGNFLQTIFDFLIIAFFIFLAIKLITLSQKKLNKLGTDIGKKIKGKKGKNNQEIVEEVAPTPVVEEAPVVETTDDILKDIRELLKHNNQQPNEEKSIVQE